MIIRGDNSGIVAVVEFRDCAAPHSEMHVASTQRCALTVAGPAPASAASIQRCAVAPAETPKRGCPAGNEPIQTHQSRKASPCFPASVKGTYDSVLQVEIRSGSAFNLVRESTAEVFGLEIVVDDFGYDDYVDANQSFALPPGIVGLSCFTLVHHGSELWFDGFVVDDTVLDNLHVDDVVAGAPFMEQNDVSVRPSKRTIQFGDDYLFTYDTSTVAASASDCDTHCMAYGMSAHSDRENASGIERDRKTVCDRVDDAIEREPKTVCDCADDTSECEFTSKSVHDHDNDNIECELTTVCDRGGDIDCAFGQRDAYTETSYETEPVYDDCVLGWSDSYPDCSEVIASSTVDGYQGECLGQDVERDCDSPVSNQSYTVALSLIVEDDVVDDTVRLPTEHSSGCPRTELSSGHPPTELSSGHPPTELSSGHPPTELSSGHPPTELSSGCPWTELSSDHALHTERSSGCPPIGGSSGLAPTERSSGPRFTEASPVADSTTHEHHRIRASQSEGHINVSVPPTCVGCHGNNIYPVNVYDMPRQEIDPVLIQQRPSAPYANALSGSDEGALPFICDTTCSSSHQYQMTSDRQPKDRITRPDSEPLDHPHSTAGRIVLQPVHRDACHDLDVACASQHVLARTGAQGNHHVTGDHVSGQTDRHPIIDARREPSDSTSIFMAALTTSDDLWPTSNADDDTTRLHPPLDDDGPAYCDTSPTWTQPPWTCGPRPPSFLVVGGPSPCPQERAPRAAIRDTPDVRAPTQVVADLAIVDVTHPPVPWITNPSAPPDSTGLAVPPHPPMTPLTPG